MIPWGGLEARTKQLAHALLRFEVPPASEPWRRTPGRYAANPTTEEHLARLLAKPTVECGRRSPGFRPNDPRLAAVAITLLRMPPEFRTTEAAPAVGELLGRSRNGYRITHFRYDLRKLRARNLAERIGSTRRYRLTRIGRRLCECIENGRKARALKRPQVTPARPVEPAALSA